MSTEAARQALVYKAMNICTSRMADHPRRFVDPEGADQELRTVFDEWAALRLSPDDTLAEALRKLLAQAEAAERRLAATSRDEREDTHHARYWEQIGRIHAFEQALSLAAARGDDPAGDDATSFVAGRFRIFDRDAIAAEETK